MKRKEWASIVATWEHATLEQRCMDCVKMLYLHGLVTDRERKIIQARLARAVRA